MNWEQAEAASYVAAACTSLVTCRLWLASPAKQLAFAFVAAAAVRELVELAVLHALQVLGASESLVFLTGRAEWMPALTAGVVGTAGLVCVDVIVASAKRRQQRYNRAWLADLIADWPWAFAALVSVVTAFVVLSFGEFSLGPLNLHCTPHGTYLAAAHSAGTAASYRAAVPLLLLSATLVAAWPSGARARGSSALTALWFAGTWATMLGASVVLYHSWRVLAWQCGAVSVQCFK